VRAPENAGSGIARVTLSFDAWGQRKIRPVVVTIPVNPQAKLSPKK